jgi:hypothetical protein
MKSDENDGLMFLLDYRVRRISKEVVEELQGAHSESARFTGLDSELHKLGDALRRIMVKEFVSVREAALLLNCSDGHVRNLVNKAQRGKAPYPIPFLDLDGVTVFSRAKLWEWAAQPKRKLRAVS